MKIRKCGILAVLSISFFLMLGGVWVVAAEDSKDDHIVQLQILTINDFHGTLTESGKNPGAAKLVTFLKELKAKNPEGTLLLSAGDMFQGTVDSNLLHGKTVVAVMNDVSFDAMTLGNHEFDWGIQVLRERIAQSNFPYVCANILERDTGKPVDFVKPYTLIKRKGVKVAIIGIATPETAYKANPNIVGRYLFEDPPKVINKLVPVLKKQNVDVIVVLSHLASWMNEDGQLSGDAVDAAFATHGIDAVVSGHSHQTVYGKVNGIPVVQADYNGRAVGVIALAFNKDNHTVTSSAASIAVPYPELPADAGVKLLLDQTQKELADVKNIAVGETVHELSHDRYGLSQTILGEWVTDTMRQKVQADVAFQNSGGLRTGIAAGSITMGKLYEVMPFDNTLFTVELTGRQIMKVLEYGFTHGQLGMVQYSGLAVTAKVDETNQLTIIAVTMADGTPLQPERIYKVVTNDFMAAGGDGFTMFKEGTRLYDTNIPVRDVLADTLRKMKVIDFSGDTRLNIISFRERRIDAA